MKGFVDGHSPQILSVQLRNKSAGSAAVSAALSRIPMLINNDFTGRCNILRSVLLTAKPLECGREAAAFNKMNKKAAASRPHSKAPFGANESMRFINRLSIAKSTR
jgi:hypothetical protein